MTTITCQVEACMNSRPLLPLTSHSQDGLVTLTASHFLLFRSPSAYPEDPRIQTDQTSSRSGINARPWCTTSGPGGPRNTLTACRPELSGRPKSQTCSLRTSSSSDQRRAPFPVIGLWEESSKSSLDKTTWYGSSW